VTGGGGWSMAYTYDANSNLLTKTDPLNITTNYVYDALNRNTQMSYSSYPNGSFYVDRFYDGATNGKGRFWYDIANNYRWEKPTDNLAYHHNKVNNYDALGRPLNHQQNFLVLESGSWQYKPFNLSRTYDLAGNVKTQNYPSGRTVNYGYDTAGRLNSFTGNLGGGAAVNYATGMKYNGYGLMSRETYGTQTPLYFNLHYNNRMQMVDLRLGSNASDEFDWSRGALIFYYGTNARMLWNPFANSLDNNGNVVRQAHYAPLAGGGSVVPQLHDYNYDWLNRITSVGEQQQNQGGQWTSVFTQAFSYDRWGNRTINVGATTPSIPGVTRKTLVVDTATNRMTSSDGCGMTYDAAGNQTYDCVGTHSYDSENRMTKAVQGGSNNYYFYDANGKRVRRILNGSQTWGGQETWFVYGFDGELVAEYTYNQVAAPLPGAPQKEYGYRGGKMLMVWDGSQAGDNALKWMVTDHLGSTRMEANKSGSLAGIRRHDYLPFGEELVASTGAQRSGVGYEPPASNVKQKFDGYERDTETGLDFAQARYFSSIQGRFTSVDPLLASGRPANPQSWNRYSFVLNRPTSLIDPSGLVDNGDDNLAVDPNDPQKKKEERENPPSPVPLPPVPEGEFYFNKEFAREILNMGETKGHEVESEFATPWNQGYLLKGYHDYYTGGIRRLLNAPRLPDAISYSASTALPHKGAGIGTTFTLARDGSLYGGVDLSGDADWRWQPLIGGSINLIWLNQLDMPTSNELGRFFPGGSASIYLGGIKGLGAGVTHVRGAGTTTNIGLSTPTISVTTSGAVKLTNTTVRW